MGAAIDRYWRREEGREVQGGGHDGLNSSNETLLVCFTGDGAAYYFYLKYGAFNFLLQRYGPQKLQDLRK